MKKSFPIWSYTILSSFVISNFALAQNANIATETQNNSILSNNAANSQGTNTFLNLNTNGGTTATNSATTNLTDAQKQLSTSYVNQGLANQIITDKCAGDKNQQMCGGQDPNSSQTFMIQSLARAYAIIGSLSGDDILPLKKDIPTTSATPAPKEAPPSNKEVSKTDGTDKSADKKDNATDYCKYIPSATETIATFQQQMTANQLSQGTPAGQTAQYNTLMKAAKNHEDRAKGAEIQETGWYGGAACYAVMASTPGGYAINTGLVVKLGAAVFLGNFYQGEVDTNKGYAEKTKAIADLLPKVGDCNPVTQTECFCNQPSAPTSDPGNYATYCQAQIKAKALAAATTHGTCVNNKMAADPNCTCVQSNSCLSSLITSQDTGNILGFGSGSGPFMTVRNLSQGQMQNGTLSASSYAQSRAIATKALNDMAGKFNLSDSNLSASEKALAKMYQDSGIPANIAAAMAKTNIPKAALDAGMAKASGASSTSMPMGYAAGNVPYNHVVDFSGGNGLGIKGRSANGNKNDDILSKFGLGKKDSGNSKVVEFAVQKAQSQNQITKSDSSIFEIISNRYLSSGRRLLQVEEQN